MSGGIDDAAPHQDDLCAELWAQPLSSHAERALDEQLKNKKQDKHPSRHGVPVVWTTQEVASMLRIHRNTVHRERVAGRLRHLRIGRRVLYTPEHVRAYLAQQAEEGKECSTNQFGNMKATCLSADPIHQTTLFIGNQSPSAESPAALVAKARAHAILMKQSDG